MTPRGEPGPAGISGSFRLTFPGFALDASFELPARGASVLFGPSGSGKTTLLRCIAGLERRCRGRLSVSGQTWQDDDAGLFLPAHRRALGFVFQEPSLFSHLSVRGNLDYGRRRAAAARISPQPPPPSRPPSFSPSHTPSPSSLTAWTWTFSTASAWRRGVSHKQRRNTERKNDGGQGPHRARDAPRCVSLFACVRGWTVASGLRGSAT